MIERYMKRKTPGGRRVKGGTTPLRPHSEPYELGRTTSRNYGQLRSESAIEPKGSGQGEAKEADAKLWYVISSLLSQISVSLAFCTGLGLAQTAIQSHETL